MRTPTPATIGSYVQDVGRILFDEVRHDTRKTRCVCIRCEAGRLSENGYPRSTTSDGRGGGQSILIADENGDEDRVPVTSIEAAAFDNGAPFPGLDTDLDKALRTFWGSARLVEDLVTKIRRHGSDTEQLAGLGDCVCCGHFCNPRKNPGDRRRHGLCPPCNTAWARWKRTHAEAIWLINWWCPFALDALRPDFMRWRRAQLKADAA